MTSIEPGREDGASPGVEISNRLEVWLERLCRNLRFEISDLKFEICDLVCTTWILRLASLLLTLGLWLGSSSTCDAQTTKGVKINRIFVPAGKAETWPEGDWVPISPKRLDELLTHQARTPVRLVPLDRAEYQAEFSPQRLALFNGRGRLQFSTSTPLDRLVPLAPCNLQWLSARWAGATPERAVVGVDETGQLRTAVPRAGSQMDLEWQLAGTRRLTGIEFDVRVPRAVSSQLTLLMPAGWSLAASVGVVTQNVPMNGFVPWVIDCGQQTNLRLTISEDDSKLAFVRGNPAVVFQQTTFWNVRRRQLEGTYDLSLDPQSNLQLPLNLTLPSDVTISGVRIANRVAAATEITESVVGSQRVLALRPQGVSNSTALLISVRLSRELPSGTYEVNLPVPLLSNLQSIMVEGRVEVRLPSSLCLTEDEPAGMRLVDVRFEDGAQRLVFQQDRKAANVVVRFDEQEKTQRLTAREFVAVDLTSNPPSFRADIAVDAQAGGTFQLRTLLPRVWEVSDVFQTGAATRRVDWFVENVDADQHRLLITFPDGLPENARVSLGVEGQFAGVAQFNDVVLPVALLENPTPTQTAVAVISPATGPNFQVVGGHYRPAREQPLDERWDWAQGAQEVAEKDAPVWTAHVWMRAADIRDARLKSQIGPAEAPLVKPIVTTPDSRPTEPPSLPPIKGKVAAAPTRVTPIFEGRLQSDLSPGAFGKDHHALTLKLRYATEDGLFPFRLPPLGQLQHVEWNGQRVAVTPTARGYSVPMSSPKAGDELTIHYLLNSESVFLRETYRVKVPEFTAPIIGFRWEVRMPSRFTVVNFGPEFSTGPYRDSTNWLRWLFGPLARSDSESFFNPLVAESWVPVIDAMSDREATTDAATGWTYFRGDASLVPESLTFEVCDRLRLKAFSWLILAATMWLGTALRVAQSKHRTGVASLWLVGCISATVLVPAAYAELLGATILGCVVVCLLPRRFIRREVVQDRNQDDRWMASTVTVQRATLTLLVIGISIRAVVSQDLPTSTATAPPLETLDVLVEFEGDVFLPPLKTGLVCVPSKAFEQLVRNFSPPTATRISPLFATSNFKGQLRDDLLVGTVTCDVWLPRSFDPREAAKSTTLVIPLPPRVVANRDACVVDGRSVVLVPTADGAGMEALIPPTVDVVGPRDVPPVAEDRVVPLASRWRLVQVSVPVRVPAVRSAGAPHWTCPMLRSTRLDVSVTLSESLSRMVSLPGQWLADPVTQQGPSNDVVWTGSTGPINALRIDSPPMTEAATHAVNYRLDLRSYCEIQDAAHRHQSLARYSVSAGEVNVVTWRLPPGAVALIDRIQAPKLGATLVSADSTGTFVSLEFSPPQTSDFTVSLPWLVASERVEDIHQVMWETPVVPQAMERLITVSKHLAGVAPSAGFSLQSEQPSISSGELEEEFLAGWPQTLQPRRPSVVVDLKSSNSTRYKLVAQAAQKSVRWHTVARIDRDTVAWSIDGEVDVTGAPSFQHELEVSANIPIESITVVQDDVNRLSHWARRGDRIVLHLRDRSLGVQTIRIMARESLSSGEALRVPQASLRDARLFDRSLEVAHVRSVDVQLSNAEKLLSSSSAANTDAEGLISLGRYRVAEGLEPRLTATLAQLEARSWCVGTVISAASRASVILNVVIEPGVLEDTILKLPGWPLATDTELIVDSELPLTLTASENESDEWNIHFPQPVSRRLTARITVPLEDLVDLDDMTEVQLTAPVFSDISTQSTAWLRTSSTTDLVGAGAPVMGAKDRKELEERQLVRTELPSTALMDWQATSLPIGPPTDLHDRYAHLPTLVAHQLRLGYHQETVGLTTIVFPTSVATTLKVPETVQVLGIALQDRSLPVSPKHLREVPLEGDLRSPMTVAHVVWKYVETGVTLRIARRELPLLRILSKHEVLTTVELTEPRNHEILLDVATSELPLSVAWQNGIELWRAAVPEERVRDFFPLQSLLAPLSVTHEAATSDVKRVLFEPLDRVRFWSVDRRLSMILLVVFLALVSVPVVASLVRLQTGERLADWPAAASLLLVVAWWLCLHWSLVGFVAVLVVSIIAVLQVTRRYSANA